MSQWVAVTDRLPEHGQVVLVWAGSVEFATFRLRARIHEDDMAWLRAKELAAGYEVDDPNEPHFSTSYDMPTIYLSSLGYADVDPSRERLTHWMPVPDGPA